MSRVRLTTRLAAIDNTNFPTDLGKDGKKEPSADKADKTLNQVTDKNQGWKEDKREENNLPAFDDSQAPKLAAVRQAVAKSVRVAVLLLGEKCPEDVIEAQARDFMASMNEAALDRALTRFAATEDLYKKEEKKDEKVAAVNDPAAAKADPAKGGEVLDTMPDKPQDKVAAEVKPVEKIEEPKTEGMPAVMMNAAEKVEEKIEEKKDEKIASHESEETKAEEKKEEDALVAAEEITFDGTENVGEQAPDKALEAALSDVAPAADLDDDKKSEGRKAGVKSLGGQARIASGDGVVADLSSIWCGAPDVKSVFCQ